MEGHEAIRLDHYAISYLGSPYAGTGRPRWMARLRDRRSALLMASVASQLGPTLQHAKPRTV